MACPVAVEVELTAQVLRAPGCVCGAAADALRGGALLPRRRPRSSVRGSPAIDPAQVLMERVLAVPLDALREWLAGLAGVLFLVVV